MQKLSISILTREPVARSTGLMGRCPATMLGCFLIHTVPSSHANLLVVLPSYPFHLEKTSGVKEARQQIPRAFGSNPPADGSKKLKVTPRELFGGPLMDIRPSEVTCRVCHLLESDTLGWVPF
jgi:hypothetical protein